MNSPDTPSPEAEVVPVPPRTYWPSWTPWAIAGLGTLLLFVIWPYAHGHVTTRDGLLVSLTKFVMVETEWIFCLAVPLVIGWMIHNRREDLATISLQPTWWAVPVLLLAGLIYWAGYKVDTRYPGYAAAQLFTAGMILAIGGKTWFRHLLFPWFFLFFLWPMPPLENLLSVPLRHFTSIATAQLLTLFGLPTIRVGAMLFSAGDSVAGLQQGELFSLGVDKPCSGINSLFTLIMIAVLYAYISLRTWKHRWILIAVAIPLAVAGNIIRMVMLAIGSKLWGMEFAVGKTVQGRQEDSAFHFVAGLMVFVVALGGMFLLASWLESRQKRPKKKAPPPPPGPIPLSSPAIRSGFAVLLFAGVLTGLCAVTPVGRTLSQPGLTLELPPVFLGISGEAEPMSDKERGVFEPGVELSRMRYDSVDTQERFFATVVRSGPITRSLHQPEVCLPGQGWNIASTLPVVIRPKDGRPAFDATILELFIDSKLPDGRMVRQKSFNIYWYQGLDISSPSYNEHVYLTYRDALLRNLNHRWSMASFFLQLPPMYLEDADLIPEIAARERLREFVEHYVPYIVVEPVGEKVAHVTQTSANP